MKFGAYLAVPLVLGVGAGLLTGSRAVASLVGGVGVVISADVLALVQERRGNGKFDRLFFLGGFVLMASVVLEFIDLDDLSLLALGASAVLILVGVRRSELPSAKGQND